MRKGSASSSLIYSVISFGSFNPFCFITTLSTIPILLTLAKTSSTLELRSNEKGMEILFSLSNEIECKKRKLSVSFGKNFHFWDKELEFSFNTGFTKTLILDQAG